jgi:hypothetical protein
MASNYYLARAKEYHELLKAKKALGCGPSLKSWRRHISI